MVFRWFIEALPSYVSAVRNKGIDDKGVRGGEYSTRPNVQDSYTFFRKLFAHQPELPISPEPSKVVRSGK
jgi:hypothetical protein